MDINWEALFKRRLQQRKDEGLYRSLKFFDEKQIDFYSNDYLGLGRTNTGVSSFQMGSTGSRLISGNHKIAVVFEKELATFFNFPDALLFNSGYAANLGVLSALPAKEDVILYDANVHASIREGMRLGLAKSYSFRHNDLNDLEEKLKRFSSHQVWVVTESIFSMHGSVSEVDNIKSLCKKYAAFFILDEAHAVGVTGNNRVGLNSGYTQDEIKIITFGKAWGGQGAAVLSGHLVRECLINFSRPFIYSTAMSPAWIEMMQQQFYKLQSSEEAQLQLNNNIRYFRTKVLQHNLKISTGTGPIQMWYPKSVQFKSISEVFEKAGIALKLILPPTVNKGEEGVRIILHSYNTIEEINQLVKLMLTVNQMG